MEAAREAAIALRKRRFEENLAEVRRCAAAGMTVRQAAADTGAVDTHGLQIQQPPRRVHRQGEAGARAWKEPPEAGIPAEAPAANHGGAA